LPNPWAHFESRERDWGRTGSPRRTASRRCSGVLTSGGLGGPFPYDLPTRASAVASFCEGSDPVAPYDWPPTRRPCRYSMTPTTVMATQGVWVRPGGGRSRPPRRSWRSRSRSRTDGSARAPIPSGHAWLAEPAGPSGRWWRWRPVTGRCARHRRRSQRRSIASRRRHLVRLEPGCPPARRRPGFRSQWSSRPTGPVGLSEPSRPTQVAAAALADDEG
jgi:hypothetical protein